MGFRALTADDELQRFAQAFAAHVGAMLPIEYLRQGSVTAAFCGTRMVGGYVIVSRGPLRLLAVIPSATRDAHPHLRAAADGSLLEVNGLWIQPEARCMVGLALLPRLCRDVADSGAAYMLLGFDDTRDDLATLYDHPALHREQIHKGPIDPRARLQTFARWNVGLVDLHSLRADKAARRWLRRHSERSEE